MSEKIGDTHWHNGQKYTLVAQTVRHETKTTTYTPTTITQKALSLGKGPIRLDTTYVKASMENAIENKRKEYIIPDFKFTVKNSSLYSNAIKYLKESIGMEIKQKNDGDSDEKEEYDEETAKRVYALVGDKLNPNKKYLSYYYGKVNLDAMMRGEHLPVYIYGVDEEVWLKLGLDMRKLVKDNDSILEWHPLFSENITEREIVEHAIQKTEQIMKMIFVSNTKVISAFVDLNDLILTYSQFFAQELENHKSSTRFKKSFFTMLFFVLENLCDLGVLAGNVVSFFTLGFMDTTQVSEALLGVFDPTTPSVLDTPDFQEWINNEKVIQGLTDAAEKSKEYPYKYVLTFNNQSLIDDIQNQIRLIENLPIYRKGSLDPQSRYWDEVIKQLQMIADLNSKTEQIIKQFECIKNSYENTP